MASLQDEGEAGMPETRSCAESPGQGRKDRRVPREKVGHHLHASLAVTLLL